ncbi:MAG: type II toxin-antitoxin system RelE/ParE family toxin [Planctomycetes bacterium]|nr:type II toxin-antitoxin system RelE/ParE family toxin [Planctomycetota bacterium]
MYEAALWWAEHRDRDQAARWLDGFEREIESLADEPEKCGVAREDDDFPFTLRQLLYGLRRQKTHRAVFEIRGDEVIVHGIRHLAQRDLTPDDL